MRFTVGCQVYACFDCLFCCSANGCVVAQINHSRKTVVSVVRICSNLFCQAFLLPMLLAFLYPTEDLIHPDERSMYTLYCYRYSCRSTQQCFLELIAKLVDGFWIFTTLFAAFRNCISVRSTVILQLRHTRVSHSVMTQ